MIQLEGGRSETLFGDQFTISDAVKQKIGNHNIEILSDQISKAKLSYTTFSGFSGANLSYGGRVKIFCEDLNDIYHFQVITKGFCIWSARGESLKLQPGDAIMLNPKEIIKHEYSEYCEKFILRIPENLIKQVCLERFQSIPKPGLNFLNGHVYLPKTKPLIRLLEAIIAESSEDCASGYSLEELYKEILAQKILSVFPNNGEPLQKYFVRQDLQVILNFINKNIKSNIDTGTLTEFSGKSLRTIYNLFSSSLSTTPKSYIKNLKLQCIRKDLKNGKFRNVTEAAYDYGFTHLGRFSSDYRSVFGELPSQTVNANKQ